MQKSADKTTGIPQRKAFAPYKPDQIDRKTAPGGGSVFFLKNT
jgi:hypothetical protein